MNYYDAKQRVEDKRWDYTCNNRPTGYCRKYVEVDANLFGEHHRAEYAATAHKCHSNGHATEEEARQCYKEYMLDHQLRFGNMSNQQQKCKICDEWTQGYAETDCHIIVLCDKHRTKDIVATLVEPPGQIWSSW